MSPLRAVYHSAVPPWLRQLPAVQALRRITVQSYLITTGSSGAEVVKRREEDKHGLPPGSSRGP